MGLSNWNITQAGGQSIIDEGGSKRCRLSGSKLMLWNGRNNLANSEIVASILMAGDTNTRGGLVLRSDVTGQNCYRLRIYGGRTYYVQKVANGGIVTTLATAYSSQPYNVYVKTRFRVDGYQLSVEEYINNVWILVTVIADNEQSIASGYSGLYGENINTSYFITFDNIEINERA